jgi:hypothetical protein
VRVWAAVLAVCVAVYAGAVASREVVCERARGLDGVLCSYDFMVG